MDANSKQERYNMPEDIEEIKSEIEDSISDIEEYRIIPYPADYTLKGLYDKWVANELVIPKYQRQYVWQLYQASRLIESFLMGLPVPGIFLYKEPETQILSIIDGHQRLKTVFGFFEGIFPPSEKAFRLRGISSKWDGSAFKELENRDQIKLRDSVLRATIVEQIDPDDDSSVFHIFERLNTGGTSLTAQEIRNCIYRGKFNDFLNAINENKDWREIFGKQGPDNRMRDVELILRFLALYYEGDNYTKSMKEFLNKFMKSNKEGQKVALEEINRIFSATMKNILEFLGSRPFNIRTGLNAAVFDSVSVAFANNIRAIPKNITRRYEELKKDNAFIDCITDHTTDVDVVKGRIALANKFLFPQ